LQRRLTSLDPRRALETQAGPFSSGSLCTGSGAPKPLLQTRHDAEHQQHQHPNGQDHGDSGKGQNHSDAPEGGLLESNRFLLIPQGFAISLAVLPLKVADLF